MHTITTYIYYGVNTLKLSMIKSAIITLSLIGLSDASLAYASSSTAVTVNNNTLIALNDWNGLFGGISAGGVLNDATLLSNHLGFTNATGTCNKNSNFASFSPGVQLGFAHQFDSKMVLGFEGDFTYNSNEEAIVNCTCPSFLIVSDRFVIRNQQQGSIRGRLGYALDNHLLPFVVVGASYADLGINYSNEGGDYYARKTSRSGLLVGGGLEWAMSKNWSVRVDYSHADYSKLYMGIPEVYGLSDPQGGSHLSVNTNTIKGSINYWF